MQRYCDECNGSGYVEKLFQDDSHWDEDCSYSYQTVLCPDCEGTGLFYPSEAEEANETINNEQILGH